MSTYLMADTEYQAFKQLEEKAMSIDAAAISAAIKPASNMRIEGDTAFIPVKGMLTPERVGFLDFFGKPQTVWGDIVGQAGEAVGKGIGNIVLETDSGGGRVDGMFEAMDAISKLDARVVGNITGQAQSAAYMLLTQAEKIQATKEYNMVGSVGVKVAVPDVKEISNSESPNKIVGAETISGKPAVQETLDDLYSIILPRMASGRNTTVETINANWGKGGTMTAKTALERGMIDSIRETKTAGRSGTNRGSNNMDMATLRAQHPDLYASAFDAGKEAGRAEFKKMATGHTKLAEMSGDYKRAMSDIAEENEADAVCAVYHAGVAQKNTMISARADETVEDIGEGKDPQAAATAAKDDDDVLVAEAKTFYGGMEVVNV